MVNVYEVYATYDRNKTRKQHNDSLVRRHLVVRSSEKKDSGGWYTSGGCVDKERHGFSV